MVVKTFQFLGYGLKVNFDSFAEGSIEVAIKQNPVVEFLYYACTVNQGDYRIYLNQCLYILTIHGTGNGT